MAGTTRGTVVRRPLGACCLDGRGTFFRVWAPRAQAVHVHLVGPGARLVALAPEGDGYFAGEVDGAGPGTRYRYRLDDGDEFPDPASAHQPDGVHGPSAVIDERFAWSDAAWRGHAREDLVIYELHVGTFTRDGTFDAIHPHLPALRELGVTAIELMPVAQFPGARNWGYDGVYPFAVQHSYGGPDGLKRLVDAAHAVGLSVLLDVVYNHLGPEGNHLAHFGPYFTDRYQTPWGQALDFDGPRSGPIRHFFVENARRWIHDFHLDGLRLDAVHSIFDASPRHVLTEIVDAVHEAAPDRHVHAIAESDDNDARLITPVEADGLGVDAQWSDDFHHALHARLTHERIGYYQDFDGPDHLALAFEQGFVYTGQHSRFRGRVHGTPSRGIPGSRFVVCAQNHDQVGNRMLGERLGQLVGFEHQKLASAAALLAPYVPLLFMGQECGDPAPFLYFVSHSDPDLVEAVRRGRREEFAAFAWRGEAPDPQAERTFDRCILDHDLAAVHPHRALLEFHRELLRLRRSVPALALLDPARCRVSRPADDALIVERRAPGSLVLVMLAFGAAAMEMPSAHRQWKILLDSADIRWAGPGGVTIPPAGDRTGSPRLALSAGQVLVLQAG